MDPDANVSAEGYMVAKLGATVRVKSGLRELHALRRILRHVTVGSFPSVEQTKSSTITVGLALSWACVPRRKFCFSPHAR